MKTLLVIVLAVFFATQMNAQWRYSGDAYAGGGASIIRVQGADGEYEYIRTAVGEGGFTFSYNNGYWFGAFNADALRDDYYFDVTGRMSLAMVDPTLGTYRVYASYRLVDDRTDFNNDLSVLSLYGEGVKRLNDDVSVNMSAMYSMSTYSLKTLMLKDYSTIALNAGMQYGIFSLRTGMEKTSYDGEAITPDTTSYRAQLYANYYSEGWLSYSSFSYFTKEYERTTTIYRPYNQIDVTTRTGYRIDSNFIPYIIGAFTMRSIDAFENTDISYAQWKAGAELNLFKHPLKVTAKIGRRDYDDSSIFMLQRNFATTDLEGEWSYWSQSSTLTVAHKREIIVYDAIEGFPGTEYDYIKDDTYVTTDYDWSSDIRVELSGSRTNYAYSNESALTADYTRYAVGLASDYRISDTYSLRFDTEYAVALYKTYKEFDTHEIKVKLLLKASF